MSATTAGAAKPPTLTQKAKGKQPVKPSSNWLQLQKQLPTSVSSEKKTKRKRFLQQSHAQSGAPSTSSFPRETASTTCQSEQPVAGPSKQKGTLMADGVVFIEPPTNTPLVRELRGMVAGLIPLTDNKKLPGNYLAIDCEMVGLGPLGSESSLARVSIVNYHGHTVLDTFVRQREHVTDWRTWVSGVRPEDMADARPFEEVQKTVAKLVEGKVLIGHAIHNDTTALLLSHPAPLTRDTQTFAKIREAAKNKRPGLKKLAEQLLGVQIQAGVHSSVTDARATMAIYRLFKSEWESAVHRQTEAFAARTKNSNLQLQTGKRKAGVLDGEGEAEDGGKKRKTNEQFPGGGRRNVSSGLSVIVRKNGVRIDPPGTQRAKRGGLGQQHDSGAGGNWWE